MPGAFVFAPCGSDGRCDTTGEDGCAEFVGTAVDGAPDGVLLGALVGEIVGVNVSAPVGRSLGRSVGMRDTLGTDVVGARVCAGGRLGIGATDGAIDGACEGAAVGAVGATLVGATLVCAPELQV